MVGSGKSNRPSADGRPLTIPFPRPVTSHILVLDGVVRRDKDDAPDLHMPRVGVTVAIIWLPAIRATGWQVIILAPAVPVAPSSE